ncbi:hypothetical protein CRV24_005215 [Beauveria bassiana]|nr:hypothetical protein CRV24_005215 [Beauveria bassiana]KAH8709852.1 hypothetical protein HC256_009759 [Beauveria bassiana]
MDMPSEKSAAGAAGSAEIARIKGRSRRREQKLLVINPTRVKWRSNKRCRAAPLEKDGGELSIR